MRLVGQLLVASSLLRDATFRNTVVLLLDHGEEGSVGVVLNRPLRLAVSAVLPAWQPWTTSPGVLFRGGPMGLDCALGLVGVPGGGAAPPGVRRLTGSLGMVDLDADPCDVVGAISGLRVFAGYAGWRTGQLEDEVAEGAWYVVPSEPRDPFSDVPQDLWRSVLRRQLGDLSLVASMPDDPALN